MGAGEYYGCNRNGDYFEEVVLRERHPTFISNAMVYKHHQNKDPNKAYGKVLYSTYNELMHRVELIVDVDAETCASEIAKIQAGEDVAFSMACRVPFDICNKCGNKAKTVAHYCECLRDHMGEILPDGFQVWANNTEPTFIDISFVFRPADRIAYAFEKVASAGLATLPRQVESLIKASNSYSLSKRARDKLAILQKLSDIEKDIESNLQSPGEQVPLVAEGPKALELSPEAQIDDKLAGSLNGLPLSGVLSGLAKSGICLNPKEFVKILVGPVDQSEEIGSSVEAKLPGIFKRILGSLNLDDFLQDDSLDFDQAVTPPRLSKLLSNLMGDRSLFKMPASRRILKITIVGGPKGKSAPAEVIKESEDRFGVADKLARAYAMYKVATLYSSEECREDPLFARLSVLQNYIHVG